MSDPSRWCPGCRAELDLTAGEPRVLVFCAVRCADEVGRGSRSMRSWADVALSMLVAVLSAAVMVGLFRVAIALVWHR